MPARSAGRARGVTAACASVNNWLGIGWMPTLRIGGIAMAELAKREMDSDALVRSVWWTLRIVFGLVPIVAGLDKFFNLLVAWEKYLSPTFRSLIPMSRSAALVSRDGSIDWLCWPRFDSPSIFGALLDETAGHWKIAPAGPFRTERRYIQDTNVLQTRFHTATGSLLMTDLMPVVSASEEHHILLPEHQILRVVECESGNVELEMLFDPRPGYGCAPVCAVDAGKLGVRVQTSRGLAVLRTDLPLTCPEQGPIRAHGMLRAGEARHFSLTLAEQWQAVLPPLGKWSRESIARSVAW